MQKPKLGKKRKRHRREKREKIATKALKQKIYGFQKSATKEKNKLVFSFRFHGNKVNAEDGFVLIDGNLEKTEDSLEARKC